MSSAGGRPTGRFAAAAAIGALLAAGAPAAAGAAAGHPAAGPAITRPADPSSSYNVLTGVSADSATDAWAVGYYVGKSVRHTLILGWNGTAWAAW